MIVYLIFLLAGIHVIGMLIKLYTNRKLAAMDGTSDIFTADMTKGKTIGRF